MKRASILSISGIFLLYCLLSACGSTQLVSSWKAPEASVQQMRNVLVVALMGSRDRELRENVENLIVDRLQKTGISAGSALVKYGPKTFVGSKESEVIRVLKSKDYDAAIIVALLDKRKEKQYNPGYVNYYPMYYRRFWGYYNNIRSWIYEPGYYTVDNKFLLKANFYDLKADKLLYSAQTKSKNPSSPKSLATEFSEKIIENIFKNGVFHK